MQNSDNMMKSLDEFKSSTPQNVYQTTIEDFFARGDQLWGSLVQLLKLCEAFASKAATIHGPDWVGMVASN